MRGLRLTHLTVAVLLAVAAIFPSPAHAQRQFDALRAEMVDDYLVTEGITNERVLDAMRATPRHLFVRGDLRQMAYFDQALDIGYSQTISPPFIVAYMTEVLDPRPEDRVLEIGTGSGYQAAVLSPLVADVYTIEIVEPLGERADRLLDSMDYENIHTRIGDGYQGWEEHAPFDKIIVTCSPESIPQPLVDQLRDGGKMIIPVGERYQQVFHLLEKQGEELIETKLLPTLFVPMTGQSEDQRQIVPDPEHPSLHNGGFEEFIPDSELLVGWHYQRRCSAQQHSDGSNYLHFENDTAGRNSHVLQAFAVSGLAVQALDIHLRVRVGDIRPGAHSSERPSLVVHFFDQRRLPTTATVVGPWLAETDSWIEVDERIVVPPTAREVILQVGLNGSRGMIDIDDVSIRAAE